MGGCNSRKTLLEAEAICSDAGVRLCTAEELQSDCSKSTGCGFDKELTVLPGRCFPDPTAHDFHGKIVGGAKINPPRLYQFLAHLGGCGAILIHEKWVLTAAHCAPYFSPGDEVVLGQHSVFDSDECVERIAAESIASHEGYDDGTLANDIALIELSAASEYAPIDRLDHAGDATWHGARG